MINYLKRHNKQVDNFYVKKEENNKILAVTIEWYDSCDVDYFW